MTERQYGRRRTRPVTETDLELAPTPRRTARSLSLVIGLITFLVYLRTMTPGMQMGDGTELAAAAAVLGVPHPTGYPLYMLLCKAWLLITMGGDVIVRTTLLNALLMAAAAGLTANLMLQVARWLWQTAVNKSMIVLAAAGALTAAFLRFHWGSAVVTEVYALEFLLMVLFAWFALSIDLNGHTGRLQFLGLTACLALGLAHHRLSVTMIIPWAVITVLAWKKRQLPRTAFAWAAAILVGGASLYAYVPLRAAAHPPINWGDATTASRFYNHVRGTEYLERGLLRPALGQSFSADTIAKFTAMQSSQFLTDTIGQFVPVAEQVQVVPGSQKVFVTGGGIVVLLGLALFGLAIGGYWFLYKAGMPTLALVASAVALQNIAILYIYNIADIRDYCLFPLWWVWLGLLVLIVHYFRKWNHQTRLYAAYASAAIPLFVLLGNWNRCNRSNDISAEMLSAMILPEDKTVMPPGSILITDDDSDTFTTWYRQAARSERRDVLNFAANFIYMPWYSAFFTAEQLKNYHIKLAPAIAKSAQEYAQQVRHGIIDANIATRPIFTSLSDPTVLQILSADFDVEPIDATEVINHGLFDEATTAVLYQIKEKSKAP